MINYYAKFISNYSTITHPLNELLKDGVEWKWSEDQERAFKQLKDKLSSAPVLMHFSEKLPLKLDTDASQYGVGAVISHVLPSGEERPIAYASRTLTKSERNYAQIEKEALSIIFGIKKFHPPILVWKEISVSHGLQAVDHVVRTKKRNSHFSSSKVTKMGIVTCRISI